MNTDQNSQSRPRRSAKGRRASRRTLRVGLAGGAVALIAATVPWAPANAGIDDLSFTDMSYCLSYDGIDLAQYVGWRTTNAKPVEPITLWRNAYVDGNLVESFTIDVFTQNESLYPLASGSSGRMTISTPDGQLLADTGTVKPCAADSDDSENTDQPDEPTEPTIPDEPTEPTIPDEPVQPTIPDGPTGPTNPEEPVEPTNPDGPTAPVESTSTPVVPQPLGSASAAPHSDGALATSSDPTSSGTLPETGRGSWTIAALAAALTTTGIAMVITGRRRQTDPVGR